MLSIATWLRAIIDSAVIHINDLTRQLLASLFIHGLEKRANCKFRKSGGASGSRTKSEYVIETLTFEGESRVRDRQSQTWPEEVLKVKWWSRRSEHNTMRCHLLVIGNRVTRARTDTIHDGGDPRTIWGWTSAREWSGMLTEGKAASSRQNELKPKIEARVESSKTIKVIYFLFWVRREKYTSPYT